MGIDIGPIQSSDGLIFQLDAANFRNYSGSGFTAYALPDLTLSTLESGVGYSSANNGSFFFDGVNDYMSFGSYTPLANTVNIWVKFNSLQNGPIIYTGSDSYASGVWSWSFFIYNSAFYWRANPGNFADFTEVPPLNTWINYTLIRDNGSAVCIGYKNGVFFGTSANSTLTNSYPNLRIGKASSVYGFFNLAQVQIYNRALSSQEVLQNYIATKRRYGL